MLSDCRLIVRMIGARQNLIKLSVHTILTKHLELRKLYQSCWHLIKSWRGSNAAPSGKTPFKLLVSLEKSSIIRYHRARIGKQNMNHEGKNSKRPIKYHFNMSFFLKDKLWKLSSTWRFWSAWGTRVRRVRPNLCGDDGWLLHHDNDPHIWQSLFVSFWPTIRLNTITLDQPPPSHSPDGLCW